MGLVGGTTALDGVKVQLVGWLLVQARLLLLLQQLLVGC